MAEVAPVIKKRSFDAAFKLRVVQFAEKGMNRGGASKFSIDKKRV